MAKTLAGVLVVVSGLLFAGCGGGNSSSSATTVEATTTTTTTIAIDYGAQYLTLVAPSNDATVKFKSDLAGVSFSDAAAVEAVLTPYADSLEAFGNALLRSSWPVDVKPSVIQLAQNAIQQAQVVRSLKTNNALQLSSITAEIQRLTAEGRSYASTVRAQLNLPAPTS